MAFYPYFYTIKHSLAYLFITGFAPMPSDDGNSWPDYILPYLNDRFTSYALRLTGLLDHGLRSRITVADRFPASFPVHNPWDSRWLSHGRQTLP